MSIGLACALAFQMWNMTDQLKYFDQVQCYNLKLKNLQAIEENKTMDSRSVIDIDINDIKIPAGGP